MKRALHYVLAGALLLPQLAGAASAPQPAVYPLQNVAASRAAEIVRKLFPRDKVVVDADANALLVTATASDAEALRQVVSGIDVKGPSTRTTEAVPFHGGATGATVARLRPLFPAARIIEGPNHSIIVSASAADLTQIRALLTSIDVVPTPAPQVSASTSTIRIAQAQPKTVARTLARALPHTRVSVSGSSLILSGPADEIAKAETLAPKLDQPADTTRYTDVYRIRFVDAGSVADLLRRSFRDVVVEVDKDLNALSVFATYKEHLQIASALTRLDNGPPGAATDAAAGSTGGAGGGEFEVVTLHAAIPGANGSPSTSSTDIAQTVTQTLQQIAPDLHVNVPPNSNQLILSGSRYSINLAKRLIGQLDVSLPLVVLDTEILEVDESVAKNLGLNLASPLLATTFSEVPPASDGNGNVPPLMGLQPLQRTALEFGAQLNLLEQKGQARILADPRITVISGKTASIRAGDSISILTTTGGGTGTVATTQLQTFQTGVTLDITAVVNSGNYVTVTLHPTVNSLEGLLNGVPQIATRDAQTTVGLKEDETLVIGGLIQDSTNRTENRIPLLGDLPLVGRAFRNDVLNKNRNELIVAVTPHVVRAGEPYVAPGPALPNVPTPQPLPTLPPGAVLPKTSVPQKSGPPGVASAPSVAAVPTASPSPAAVATDFIYGHIPDANAGSPDDPPQIQYVRLNPKTVTPGKAVSVEAITTANVTSLRVEAGATKINAVSTGSGRWRAEFTVPGGAPKGQIGVSLTASSTGFSPARIVVPLVIAAP